jgi:hypothetical protein
LSPVLILSWTWIQCNYSNYRISFEQTQVEVHPLIIDHNGRGEKLVTWHGPLCQSVQMELNKGGMRQRTINGERATSPCLGLNLCHEQTINYQFLRDRLNSLPV